MPVSNTNQSSNINSPLRLDESARQNVLAMSQQRMLQSIGLLKGQGATNDQVSLSPLKGLLSAAAGSYMQSLKKNAEEVKIGKGMGGFGDLSAIRKQIEAELAASAQGGSSVSDDAGTTITVGGSGKAATAARAGDKPLGSVIGTMLDAGGSVKDNRDGSYSFSFGDFSGTIRTAADGTVYGQAATGMSVVDWKKNSAGEWGVSSDGSESKDAAANVERLSALLSGDAAVLKKLINGGSGSGGQPADGGSTTDPVDTTKPADGGATVTPADTTPPADGGSTTPPADTTPPVDTTKPADPVAPAAPADTSARDKLVGDAIATVMSAGGSVTDNRNGSYTFSVGSFKGTLVIGADAITGSATTGASVVDYKKNSAGESGMSADGSASADENMNVKRITTLLAGDAAGLKQLTTEAPASEAATATAPAATETWTAAAAGTLAGSLMSLTTSVLGTLSKGSDTQKNQVNARIFLNDLSAAGAKLVSSASDKITFSLNGVSGTMQMSGDRFEVSYGSGKAQVSLEVRTTGRFKIDGDNSNTQAMVNANALRTAVGVATSATVKMDKVVSKFDRTGNILNLLA